MTTELAREGMVRDLVRVVQQARRDAGLKVSDRISLTVDAAEEVVTAVRAHEKFLATETLATEVRYDTVTDGFEGTVGDGAKVTVSVATSG